MAITTTGRGNTPTATIERKLTIKSFLADAATKKRFEEILGQNAASFMASITNITLNNTDLSSCDPTTVLGAAFVAASLKLPIDPNLGFSYIIPYKNKAQFQMGYKGYIQLAARTGLYKTINAIPVFENQFKTWNALTEELSADFSIQGTGEEVGYVAYFQTIYGYSKTLYWTKDMVKKHAQRYSKSFNNANGRWQLDFSSMALKTVIKQLLSKWGILSIDLNKPDEIQQANKFDQAVTNGNLQETPLYIDNNDDNEEVKANYEVAEEVPDFVKEIDKLNK